MYLVWLWQVAKEGHCVCIHVGAVCNEVNAGWLFEFAVGQKDGISSGSLPSHFVVSLMLLLYVCTADLVFCNQLGTH